jgi:hypothetical protein
VITPAVVILPIFPVVEVAPSSVNQRLPSGPVVIPAGFDNEPPNSVMVPAGGAVGVGELVGVGEGAGVLDGRGDAVGDELGAGLADGLAVGVADGVADGTLPPPRIGATGVPLLPLHPQKTPRTTMANPPWR